MNTPRIVRRLALAGMLLCVVVVVLGAYVRLTAAGLGCPDWPGCYGHVTPSAAMEKGIELDPGKAWREMIHRYAATTLGLIVVVITAIAIANRGKGVIPVRLPVVLLATIVFQGILGMLTVTWLLKPLIVTLHLVFGMTTLALLTWLWLSLRPHEPGIDAPRLVRRWALVAIVLLGMQIALGGWTSSNYAAVACPDFPTCQGSYWPQMDFEDAFVLWHGLGINYEGGVLDHPARVAIHFVHRLGAIVASIALAIAAVIAIRRVPKPGVVRAAVFVLAALALQLTIGVLMVWRGFPLWLATAHNAGAALLLLGALLLNRRVRA